MKLCAWEVLSALAIIAGHAGGQGGDSVLVVSERLGTQIDRLERGYFGLFPDVAEYVSADVYRVSDSQIGFKIHRQDGAAMDTVVVIDTSAAAELRAYLEGFETISQRRRVTKVKLDANVARRPQRVVNTPQLVKISFLGGAVDSGLLLCITDTSFVLWNAHGSPQYRWQDAWERAHAVHCSAVETIVIIKRASVLMMTCAGGFAGMLVAGGRSGRYDLCRLGR